MVHRPYIYIRYVCGGAGGEVVDKEIESDWAVRWIVDS